MKTLLSEARKNALKHYIQLANKLDGIFVEVGVYKGGSAELIAKNKNEDKALYLFDTFEGMPAVDPTFDNHHKENDFNNTSYKAVCAGLAVYKNVFVYKGVFPDVHADLIKDQKFALVHIDVDIYKSCIDCLNFFYPRMVDKGIIVLDDYERPSCKGVTIAVDEFLKDKPEVPVWKTNYQACIVKGSKA